MEFFIFIYALLEIPSFSFNPTLTAIVKRSSFVGSILSLIEVVQRHCPTNHPQQKKPTQDWIGFPSKSGIRSPYLLKTAAIYSPTFTQYHRRGWA